LAWKSLEMDLPEGWLGPDDAEAASNFFWSSSHLFCSCWILIWESPGALLPIAAICKMESTVHKEREQIKGKVETELLDSK